MSSRRREGKSRFLAIGTLLRQHTAQSVAGDSLSHQMRIYRRIQQSWCHQPGTPAYCSDPTIRELPTVDRRSDRCRVVAHSVDAADLGRTEAESVKVDQSGTNDVRVPSDTQWSPNACTVKSRKLRSFGVTRRSGA